MFPKHQEGVGGSIRPKHLVEKAITAKGGGGDNKVFKNIGFYSKK